MLNSIWGDLSASLNPSTMHRPQTVKPSVPPGGKWGLSHYTIGAGLISTAAVGATMFIHHALNKDKAVAQQQLNQSRR